MIFVDADVLIGISVETDPLHNKSVFGLEILLKKKESLVTSWDVIDEVATKLSQFAGKKTAIAFLKKIKEIDIAVKFVDEISSKETIDLFLKQTSKRVSMTDCANMVIARLLGVTTFFSFDEHYKKNGFELLGEIIGKNVFRN